MAWAIQPALRLTAVIASPAPLTMPVVTTSAPRAKSTLGAGPPWLAMVRDTAVIVSRAGRRAVATAGRRGARAAWSADPAASTDPAGARRASAVTGRGRR